MMRSTALGSVVFAFISLFASCPFLSEDTRIRHYRAEGDDAFTRDDYREAEKQYKAALDLAKRHGADNTNFIFAAGDLARLYSVEKRDTDAEALFRQRLLIGEKVWAKDPGMLSWVYHDLALFYLTRNRYDDAKPVYERLLALKEQAFGPDAPEVADTLELYALLFHSNGHDEEATQMEARAKAIRAKRG
jgi:tetratricopeptide (TPR) repeat protein